MTAVGVFAYIVEMFAYIARETPMSNLLMQQHSRSPEESDEQRFLVFKLVYVDTLRFFPPNL